MGLVQLPFLFQGVYTLAQAQSPVLRVGVGMADLGQKPIPESCRAECLL